MIERRLYTRQHWEQIVDVYKRPDALTSAHSAAILWADKQIESLRRQVEAGQWVSVDDRLPEDKQPVLAGTHTQGTAIFCTYFRDGGFSVFPAGLVTHWMPIPPLPTEGERDE